MAHLAGQEISLLLWEKHLLQCSHKLHPEQDKSNSTSYARSLIFIHFNIVLIFI